MIYRGVNFVYYHWRCASIHQALSYPFSLSWAPENSYSSFDGEFFLDSISPQSFIITFSFLLAQQLWGLFLNFDWLVHLVECPKVWTTTCNFGYQPCGCIWIFRPLSYSFRSLVKCEVGTILDPVKSKQEYFTIFLSSAAIL